MTASLTTDQFRQARRSRAWHKDFLRNTPTADLLDRLEAWQYTRLENIEHEGGRQFCELQIDDIRAELTRRRKILARAQSADEYAPRWPSKEEREQITQQRIEAVKYRWPIDLFCEQVMFCELTPTGRGKFKTNCPFPDHHDKTPSFSIDADKGVGYCFGCQRGGDIITLAEMWFQTDKFIDTLKNLEALSPVGRVA